MIAPSCPLQGNYSDVLVHLSNIYSDLRGDTSGVKNEDSAQGFVRSTTKYWVRTADATTVKHHILQHLPVSLFKKDNVSYAIPPLLSPPCPLSCVFAPSIATSCAFLVALQGTLIKSTNPYIEESFEGHALADMLFCSV